MSAAAYDLATAVEQLTAERDRARDLAVALEQQVARAEALAWMWIEAAHNVRDVTGDYNDGREFEACAHDLRAALNPESTP